MGDVGERGGEDESVRSSHEYTETESSLVRRFIVMLVWERSKDYISIVQTWWMWLFNSYEEVLRERMGMSSVELAEVR